MASSADTVCIILCGGRSSRMGGGDKPLLPLGGRPMLAHIVERIRPQVSAAAISSNGNPSRYAFASLPVIPDSQPDSPGPLAGILAGMDWASALPGCNRILSVAGDTPFFPSDLARRLGDSTQDENAIAVAASAGRRHPVIALWPLSIRNDLERFLKSGFNKVSAFVDMNRVIHVEFPALTMPGGRSIDPFFNVNTPADLDEARRILERMAE
jgi:molybdopterin-guanine dinucleotide biosynthesis protein A